MAISLTAMAVATVAAASVPSGPTHAMVTDYRYAVCGVIFDAPDEPAAYTQIVRLTYPRDHPAIALIDATFSSLLRDVAVGQHRSECFLSSSSAGVQVARAAWERQVGRPIAERVEIRYKYIWPPILKALRASAQGGAGTSANGTRSPGIHAVVEGSVEAGIRSVALTQIRSQ